jgi:hypothetical protein
LKKIQWLVGRELENYATVYKRWVKAVKEVKLASELASVLYKEETSRKDRA